MGDADAQYELISKLRVDQMIHPVMQLGLNLTETDKVKRIFYKC
jgi:hypothetical protein